MLFLNSFLAISQSSDSKIFNATLIGGSFNTFIKEVESMSNLSIFYDPLQTDSIKLNEVFENKSAKEIFDFLAKKTSFRFSIHENQVFITKNIPISTKLPVRYFESDVEENINSVPEYTSQAKKSAIKSAIENKIIEIGSKASANSSSDAKISGYLKDEKSGESIIGAIVYANDNQSTTVSTDANGFFSMKLPKGKHEIKFRSIGMKNTKRQILLLSDGKLNIEMSEETVSLNEVTITDKKTSNVERMQMGMEKMEMKAMKQVPSVFGETDIIRVVMALPGVQTAGESSTGLIVRGGGADQNLILFNEAPIYNPSHLFGFFSSFNPDVVKDVELHKSSIPSEYAGRLSSVLKINGKDADMKKFHGNLGLGLLTAKGTFEIPIIKDKTSLLIAGRSAWSTFLLKKVPLAVFQDNSAYFWDGNLQLTHRINQKNTLRITSYLSKDIFGFNLNTALNYTNLNLVMKWNKVINTNFNSEITGSYSYYGFDAETHTNPINASDLAFKLNQYNLKADFKHRLGNSHHLDFGFASTLYQISPGDFTPFGNESIIKPKIIEPEKAIESAIYIADNFEITPRFSIYGGLRVSMFNYLGAKTVTKYEENKPLNEDNITSVDTYSSGQFIKTYAGLEPRLSAKFSITESSSFKLSYNRNRQYINQLNNATAITPTDIWKLSDYHIRPQIGDQFSLGYYKNLKQNIYEISTEVYYKNIIDAVDYKNGANLLLNQNLERDVINAQGKAYGAEFMLKKTKGKLNGWISYTFSRSFVKIDRPDLDVVVNNGEYFAGNFDKPHSVNFIGNYKLTKRLSFSLNIVYSTGRPITLPNAKYQIDGMDRIFYSDRNQYRIPDYFRSDISFNLDGNHRLNQRFHNSWTLSVYNITGRQNVYSIFFRTDENGDLKGYQMSIFGIPIPTITYNLKF